METKKTLRSLQWLEDEELLTLILKSKELSASFETEITESEMAFLEDKIQELAPGLSGWSFGVYGNNYMEVGDPSEFAYRVNKMISKYGADEKTEKAAASLLKLLDCNLIRYKAQKVADMICAEFNEICKYIGDLSYSFYEKERNDAMYDYLDSFRQNLDGYFVDDAGNLFKAITNN